MQQNIPGSSFLLRVHKCPGLPKTLTSVFWLLFFPKSSFLSSPILTPKEKDRLSGKLLNWGDLAWSGCHSNGETWYSTKLRAERTQISTSSHLWTRLYHQPLCPQEKNSHVSCLYSLRININKQDPTWDAKKKLIGARQCFQITYSTCWENKTLYLKHNRKKNVQYFSPRYINCGQRSSFN